MIDKNPRDRNRFINGILIVAAIAMLVASIFSVYSAWRTGLAQSRAETASRLMAIRTSPRSTETPGINAWVSWSLLHNNLDGESQSHERLRKLVVPRTGRQFPEEFVPLLKTLQMSVPENPGSVEFLTDEDLGGTLAPDNLEFRKVDYVKNGDQVFVLTARKTERVQSEMESYSAIASEHLSKIFAQWKASDPFSTFDEMPTLRSARVARFYVLNEDEALISLPVGESVGQGIDDRNSLYLSEGDEFRKNPRSPTFVSNNFFFNFKFDEPHSDQAVFTGMYLDLGGLGLVASVIRPVVYNGKRCALGADVAFDIDWKEFARNLSPNLINHVAIIDNADSERWNPWNEFLESVPSASAELRSSIQELAERGDIRSTELPRKAIYLETTSDGGEVMAIQVNRSTWLLLLVAADEIKLPWTTMCLTGLVFLTLLFRIEQNRRQAVDAQKSALNEMQEKQNLLDTMQVPLMVVDPNTDQVVYCNRAAEVIGMEEGDYFGRDIVSSDPQSQEQYRKTQTLGEEHRRAYGVPIQIGRNDREQKAATQHAIVRSVAVTAPIETLHADERHRLGILFLIDEQNDLAMLLEQKIDDTRIDEKRRLSGLMNHGIDSLARVLRRQIESPIEERDDQRKRRLEFCHWLSSYLSERIQLLAWTLEHWGERPRLTEQCIIERETVKRTLQRFDEVFLVAAADRHLRERLHWNNGPISNRGNVSEGSIIETSFDWDEDVCFAVPRDGVFGFFLSEALTNAARHGKAGSRIHVEVELNRTRNELAFRVENQLADTATEDEIQNKPFGGIEIMKELARLSNWSEVAQETQAGSHVLSWSIPAIRRKPEDGGD